MKLPQRLYGDQSQVTKEVRAIVKTIKDQGQDFHRAVGNDLIDSGNEFVIPEATANVYKSTKAFRLYMLPDLMVMTFNHGQLRELLSDAVYAKDWSSLYLFTKDCLYWQRQEGLSQRYLERSADLWDKCIADHVRFSRNGDLETSMWRMSFMSVGLLVSFGAVPRERIIRAREEDTFRSIAREYGLLK